MSENLDLVRSIFAAWERGDYGSTEWAVPDIEYAVGDANDARPRRGVAGMATAWGEFLSLWSEFSTTAEQYTELEDGRVAALTAFGGRGKMSGLELGRTHGEGLAVFSIHDGKVTNLTVYMDRTRGLADLGLDGHAQASASPGPG
jgi:ketosteroid isomerase-like protein